MLRSLATAATGMDAQSKRIDTIAHNLANVGTTGYKKARPEFQDLFYDVVRSPTVSGTGEARTSSVNIGLGVRLAAVTRVFTQGNLMATGIETDLAIEGEGFFEVRLPNGQQAYTRDGSLRINIDGQLVTSHGFPLVPEINIPNDSVNITIDPEGIVHAIDSEAKSTEIGQINLVRFSNPSALHPNGRNLYLETALSGEPREVTPGTEGAGTISQGFLEGSNVNVAEELVAMIMAQRAYELTARVVGAADEMLKRAANLR